MAVMLAVPMLVELKLTEHCAVWGVGFPATSVQGLPVNEAPEAIPDWVNVTDPVGVVGEAEASTIVAMQVVAISSEMPKGIVDGLHATVVVVGWTAALTVTGVDPWLVPCEPSPP